MEMGSADFSKQQTGMNLAAGVNCMLKNNHQQKQSWSKKNLAEFMQSRSETCVLSILVNISEIMFVIGK